jgi:hypothetical protein
MTVIKVDHGPMMATAALLSEAAEKLKKSTVQMRESIAPLTKNWFLSGSPTGVLVNESQQKVDEAMKVIGSQLTGVSETVAQHSTSLQKKDQSIAGGR